MTPPTLRVTRGFSIDDDGQDAKPVPRRVRTRQQIMNGEGRRPPASVELKLLAHNPFNPRDELTEIEETAESLKQTSMAATLRVSRARGRALASLSHYELIRSFRYPHDARVRWVA
jgi:ParB family chromosome partitioning protein